MRCASRLLLAGIAVLCVLIPVAIASGQAAPCPGALPAGTCAYTTAGQVGNTADGFLRFPNAVAVAPDGSVVVGDQGSHVVQVFNPDGSFRNAIGSSGTKPGQLTSVGAVAVAPDGTIFVAEGTSRVERYAPDGTHLKTITGSDLPGGRLRFGTGRGNDSAAGGGLAVGGSNLFVADSMNNRIVRFSLDGSGGMVLVAPGTLAFPRGLAVRKTRLLVADDQNHRVLAFDTGGKLLKAIGGQGNGPGKMSNPYGVALDAPGRLFVADDLNQRIQRFSTQPGYKYRARWGSYGTQAGQLAYPRSIATDAAGNIYVANTGNDRVDVFDLNGRLLRTFGKSGRASGQFDKPTGVAADANGFRAVTDSINGRVEFLRPDGSVATIWGSPNPGPTILSDPVAVAFDGAGNGYVLDQRKGRIVVFSRTTGKNVRYIGKEGTGAGQLLEPEQLAITPGGTIVVADTGNGRIARFRSDGVYLGAITGIGRPHGVAISPDGSRLYVARGDNHITVYDPESGDEIDDFGGTGSALGKLNAPAQLSVDAAGNLWVADRGNNRVQEFGPYGQRLASFGTRGTGIGEFVHPTGVSVDCNGVVTVADTGNNRVQGFQLAAPAAVGCSALGPLGTPPALKFPTLPSPLGPQITPLRVLRTTGVLKTRTIPVRVGCESACTLKITGTVTQTGRPAKKNAKKLTLALQAITLKLDAGHSVIARPSLTIAQMRQMRDALHGLRGLSVALEFTATGSDTTVPPTEQARTIGNARA